MRKVKIKVTLSTEVILSDTTDIEEYVQEYSEYIQEKGLGMTVVTSEYETQDFTPTDWRLEHAPWEE